MRLRKVPNADQIIKAHGEFVVLNPLEKKGRWQEEFSSVQPIHIEVGMGKGQFILQMAKLHPEINYIGIEVVSSVLIRAIEKIKKDPMPNVKFICIDAKQLTEVFSPGEVERIYLNFSDPWPKNRHEKRRLTYSDFLKIFETILIPSGEIHFKTDNQGLFEYSLMSMSQYGMAFKFVSLDLHNSHFEGNVMTEYEERFTALKQRIYRLEAYYNRQNRDE